MNDVPIGRNGNRHERAFATWGDEMNRRARGGIPGLSFSWKRALGISGAKASLSRKTGVPLTESGLERKLGRSILRVLLGGIFGGKR